MMSNKPASLLQRILSVLDEHGDSVFLRHCDADLKTEEFTYKQVVLDALRASSLFDQFDAPPGSTIVLLLSNPKDVFFIEVAALLTGRIPIVSAHPSPKLSVDDFAMSLLPLIDHAEPALIVADSRYAGFLSSAMSRRVVSLDHMSVPPVMPELVERSTPPLFIQYSSGTTGTKKGVAISQEQLLWQVDAYAEAIGLNPNDHIVSWLPYYHDMGLITALMMPLLTGVKVTLLSPFDWVKNPLSLFDVISRDNGTLCWLPNFAYNFLAQAARRKDISHLNISGLRGVVNCSEPISDASHHLFTEAFSPQGFNPGALTASYAMAETTFAITSGGFGQLLKTDKVDRSKLRLGKNVGLGEDRLVSSGLILPGTDVRIVDADGSDLSDRQIGEITVSSPSVMQGYFKNISATIDSQAGGYFKTGDLGYRDGRDLFVTGRIKDLIITAGRNIYPQDIEAVVNDIAGVDRGRCVAFGVVDENKGTESVVIVAETYLSDNGQRKKLIVDISQEVSAQFDIALADVHLAAPKWLKKSTSGKISRGQNRDRYLDQKKQAKKEEVRLGGDSQADVVRRCIYEVTGSWVESADSPLLTSGLIDSLAMTNLMMGLEDAFGIELPVPDEAEFEAYESINSIIQLLDADFQPKAPPVRLVVDRRTKANYIANGNREIDTLILGSSRSYLVQARRAQQLGFSAFQFAVAGARAEEFYCMTRFVADISKMRLKTVVVGVDPLQFAPHLPMDLRFTQSRQLFRYMEPDDMEGLNGLKVDRENEGFGSQDDVSKRLALTYQVLDQDAVFDRATGDIDNLWGYNIPTMPVLNYTYDNQAKLAPVFMLAQKCKELHPRRLYYFKKFINLTQQLECDLHIYTNPFNSEVAQDIGAKTPYWEAQSYLIDFINDALEKNVTLHEFKVPADFKGIDQDFFDGSHIGRHNGDAILDFILGRAENDK